MSFEHVPGLLIVFPVHETKEAIMKKHPTFSINLFIFPEIDLGVNNEQVNSLLNQVQ